MVAAPARSASAWPYGRTWSYSERLRAKATRDGEVSPATGTPRLVRDLTTFGYSDQHGHGEVSYHDVRVPAANLLGPPGGGFAMAQARLGPGRVHHCMRAIGMAERALELMVERARHRAPFGRPLAEQGAVSTWIAESRLEIDQARLLVLRAAWLMDTAGNRAARTEIAGIKVVAARTAAAVIDRAIQVFGAAGLSADTPLAAFYAIARQLRIVDGPDEVHLRSVARDELSRSGQRGGGRGGDLRVHPDGAGELRAEARRDDLHA